MNVTAGPLSIVTPLTLEGSVVRLEPIRLEHAEAFWEVAKDHLEDIFRWIPYSMRTRADFEALIAKTLAEQERGESVAFATVERGSGRIIGSTRFMNIDRINRRVEIGSTWIAPAWQRTAVNTEAKYLMLRHAFEAWGCMSGRAQDRCAERTIAQRDSAHWREGRRHAAAACDHLDGTRSRFGVLQHPGR